MSLGLFSKYMTTNVLIYFLDHNSSTGGYQWRNWRGMGQEKEEIMGGRRGKWK